MTNDRTIHISPDHAGESSSGMSSGYQESPMSGRTMLHEGYQRAETNRPDFQQPAYQVQQAQAIRQGRSTECPYCGAHADVDADFCEVCHRYIRPDVCSFCGTALAQEEAYCPECGSPRGGVVCPTCHTINEFSFCKKCGTALTDEAKVLIRSLQGTPEYREMVAVSDTLQELDKALPFNNEADRQMDSLNQQLRNRVFDLLKNDGDQIEKLADRRQERMSAEELARKKAESIEKLTALLDNFAIQATPSPAVARNYAMASKPQGVRLAWQCNYKHALHSSPCGCAKPHLGGKWIILGKGSMDQIKDDNATNG
ncbi:MAG: zinc ribbon domain-containing protein [Prevotella sp.]